MKTHHLLASLTLTFALLLATGCNSGKVTDAGRYLADRQQFGTMIADKMIETGKAPAEARPMLIEKLKSCDFDLRLAADGTFTAAQTVLAERRTYKGTWTKSGTSFVLNQTHDNGRELEDRMAGTLIDGKLDLNHESDGGTMNFVLYHENAAAAPPR
jgi:hypothetical protein